MIHTRTLHNLIMDTQPPSIIVLDTRLATRTYVCHGPLYIRTYHYYVSGWIPATGRPAPVLMYLCSAYESTPCTDRYLLLCTYLHWSIRSGSTATYCTHSMYVQYLTHNIQWCMYVRKYVQYNDINIDVAPILPVSASTLTDLQVFRKQDSAEVLLPVIISCLQFGPHQPLHCKDAPPHGNRPQPSPIALPSVSIQDLSWDSVFSLYKIQGT